MNLRARLVILVAVSALSCSRGTQTPAPVASAPPPAQPPGASMAKLPGLDARAAAPARRHVVRNAELAVEDDDPGRAQQKAIALAEQVGGFTLSSESVGTRIDIVLRIPAEKFDTTLAALRALGRGAGTERVTGEDVSEEYVDLEARRGAARALEAQLLEILKSTKTVGEMMEVHARLADVRGEIEKMEGRLRFLDDRTALSTIRLQILAPASRTGPGFADSLRRAGDDVVMVASGIVTGGIRLGGVLLPVFVMIVLPGYAITRAVLRRRGRAGRLG